MNNLLRHLMFFARNGPSLSLIIVNTLEVVLIYASLAHCRLHGFTMTDLVSKLFCLSLKCYDLGHESDWRNVRLVISLKKWQKNTVLIFLIALALMLFSFFRFYNEAGEMSLWFDKKYDYLVYLQRIALSLFLGALVLYLGGPKLAGYFRELHF